MKRTLIAIAVLAAAAACTEQPQTNGSGVRQDQAAFQGTGSPFVAPGWKAGEKVSWEQQLKARAVNTQNEYTKVN
ncbi:hypothetical protein [Ramlibacter sp.]|uniref:hypothetical protein n=1 Tax=Ramlibacter sp. TaxID=1917967 RepID=UPI002B58D2E4|nr:hypothetical protein [Ramlibacter sp.]HWI82822.1 hypothetical protein [Ramlibacter sp.]